MNEQKIDVYVMMDAFKQKVTFTQGTDAIDMSFMFRDFDIPEGASASATITKPSGKQWMVAAEVDTEDNSLTVSGDPQITAEVGTAMIQLDLLQNDRHLLTFSQPIHIRPSVMAIDSETGSPLIDEYLDQIQKATEDANAAKDAANSAAQAANDAAEAVEGAVSGVINDNQVSTETTYSSQKLNETYVLQQDYITNAEIDALDDDISDVPDGENILLQLAEKVENKADSMSLDDGFLQLTSEGRKIGTAVSLPDGGGDGEGTVIETIDNTEIENLFEEE